ncbi:hypothetical protein K0T92_10695 [Paenibacillus oenotherae]|uniref:Uncharacterized protein n=1 Tax=Paenibacillus oenotherae TaxID=1435645 RepID=A0ABS7D5T2_9BACL|nr:hypothetical protein [Paenibacillus oenotherae]MBW7475216.1 hypothetical protein [Paenibacillus oenotherae]
MKPLSVLLVFLVMIIPLVLVNDSKKSMSEFNQKMYKQYGDDFQSAVDDAGEYLSRLEAQHISSAVRYQQEKQLELDEDVLNVFYNNLALKYGIENNPVAIENLKIHMPAMVMFRYTGYVMITLDDSASYEGHSVLKTVFWPQRPYWYLLNNGNVLYFTLDDKVTVYDKDSNEFYQGDYDSVSAQTNLAPLMTIDAYREVRQSTITSLIEEDLAAAINRHMELIKRMGLSIQFSLPRGAEQQSVKDIGFMAFIQGYPLPGGERLDAYSYGGGAVVTRKTLVGTVSTSGRHVAYGKACVPSSGVTEIERFYDSVEAVRKGYFIEECS